MHIRVRALEVDWRMRAGNRLDGGGTREMYVKFEEDRSDDSEQKTGNKIGIVPLK